MCFETFKTPDGTYFRIEIISKEEADRLEMKYKDNEIKREGFSLMNEVAYCVNSNKILYRQFYKGEGFIFPSLDDYNTAMKGKKYYNCSIFVNEDGNLIPMFGLMPIAANSFREIIKEEILNYEAIDENTNGKFFLLNDYSVILIQKRTEKLSDGYWFNSIHDFDYCYYILAGKEKPKKR